MVCRVNLRAAGFETLEAATGRQALEMARTERPDLIVLDIMLPELDGWCVAEDLQSSEETRDIPVIFVSAKSEPADQVRAHELGGLGYVTKPFDPGELPRVVARTLDRVRRGEREALRAEWRDSLERG